MGVKKYENLDSVEWSIVDIVKGGSIESAVRHSLSANKVELPNLVDSVQLGVDKLYKHDSEALLLDSSMMEYYTGLQPCHMTELNHLKVKQEHTLILYKNSPMTTEVSLGILQMKESGRIDQLYRKWFMQRGCSGSTAVPKLQADLSVVTGPAIIAGIGLLAASALIVLKRRLT